MLLFVLYSTHNDGMSLVQSLWYILFVTILFLFVILHEFGHILVARRYGVETKDVIISPIGGVARLLWMPKNPWHELFIALGGPAVNVVLGLIFFIFQLFTYQYFFPKSDIIDPLNAPGDLAIWLMWINIILVLFNMIPAFPMDGGRVFRSLMTILLSDRKRATKIASVVGQIIAVGLLAGGAFLDHYILMLISVFVFFMARREYSQVKLEHLLDHTLISDIMRTQFTVLGPKDAVGKVFPKDMEESYLVKDANENVLGVLTGSNIEKLKKAYHADVLVEDYVSDLYVRLEGGESVSQTFLKMNLQNAAIGLVNHPSISGSIIGVVDRALLMTFVKEKGGKSFF